MAFVNQFLRMFSAPSQLTDYVNANEIDAEDIECISERYSNTGWALFFRWVAADHPPVAESPTQVGDGTVTLSGVSTVGGVLGFVITTAGATGAAEFKWNLDGGALSVATVTGAAVAIGTTGLTAAFVDGAVPADSFQVNDVFSWVARVGNDPPSGKGV